MYSIDPYHAAVFSLRTMNFALLPDPNLGGRQLLSNKAASTAADVIALSVINDKGQRAISVYEGAPLSLRATFLLVAGQDISFDRGGDEVLISYDLSSSTSTLAALDWRAGTLAHLGRYGTNDILRALPASANSTMLLVRRRAKDAWLHEGGRTQRLTQDGQNFSASMFPDGDLLIGKADQNGGVSIWRQDRGGTLARVTAGPLDLEPDVSADGSRWVYVDGAQQQIMLCNGRSASSCSVVRKEGTLSTWPRFSPDGTKIAYVTLAGSQRVSVLSLVDGKVKRLGAVFGQCPPLWSSPEKLWTFEGSAKRYFWVERDIETGAETGRRIDMGESLNDANQDPDERRCWPPDDALDGPFLPRLRIETEEVSSLLRLTSDIRQR